MKRLLLALALLVLATPALAQNPTCPTRPVGDSTNACASTAFVQNQVSPFFITCPASQWIRSIAAGLSICSQPALSDISGISGVPANVLNTQVGTYTITNTDCGKTILLNGNSFFTITLPSVSGFPSNCIVTVLNGDSGRGKALSGFPTALPTPPILWPNQSITVAIESGGWGILNRPGRWKIPLGTVVFADAILGNDNNDCLAAGVGSACQSIDGALRIYAKDQWDLTGSSTFFNNAGIPLIFVQLADNDTVTGTCTTCYSLVHMAFSPVGNEGRATIVIRGNTVTPGNTIISDPGGANIGAYGAVNIELYSLQIGQSSCASSPKANANIQAGDGANVRIEANVIIGCATGVQLSTINHGSITADEPFTISGGGSFLAASQDQSEINLSGVAITCSGNPAYTQQTVFATQGGFANLINTTYSGCGGVTGTKFNVIFGGQIFTNTGCSVTSCGIPGNANGLLGATGQIDNFIGLGTSVATGVTGLPLTTGVTGTLPVANGGTNDTGTAWTAFTLSPSCGSATFTTTSARQKTLGKTIWFEFDITFTALGTCVSGASNVLTFNLPATAQSGGGMAARENSVAGKTVGCSWVAGAATGTCTPFDGVTSPSGGFANSWRLPLSGVMESQ
jgi:hypothetical protein